MSNTRGVAVFGEGKGLKMGKMVDSECQLL